MSILSILPVLISIGTSLPDPVVPDHLERRSSFDPLVLFKLTPIMHHFPLRSLPKEIGVDAGCNRLVVVTCMECLILRMIAQQKR